MSDDLNHKDKWSSGYMHRTLCSVLDEMRECFKTHSYASMPGLIEEVQVLGNRMEAALYGQKDLNRLEKHHKKRVKEYNELIEKYNAAVDKNRNVDKLQDGYSKLKKKYGDLMKKYNEKKKEVEDDEGI